MKTVRLLLLVGLCGLFHSCMDLDTFITAALFNPTRVDSYQLGAYADGELAEKTNALWSDEDLLASNAVFDAVTFTSGGYVLHGYQLKHTAGGNGNTVFFCHGNHHSIDNYWARSKLLFQTGCDVFVFDYRGYGMSEGKPSEEGILEDARAALDYVINDLGVPRNRIVIYGYSMGSVAAVEVAANYNMDDAIGLVLEAPIGSMEIFVQDAVHLPLPSNYLSKYRLANVGNISKVTVPLLWLHGTEDSALMRNTHGQAVYDNYGGATKYEKLVEAAEHSDIPEKLGEDFGVYIQAIRDFANGLVPFGS